MSYDMTAYAELQLKKMRRRAVWKKIMCVLGCMVVFCTVYALILPAITMTDTPYCGIEEHVHGESCYKQELVCTIDVEADVEELEVPLTELPAESETPAETILVEVVAESEVPVEPEMSAEPELLAEAAPALTEEPAPAHVHGEGCYEAVLTCPETEHGHEKQCFSNPAADVETAEVWEQSLPSSLSGIWREDMVAVAKSQLGYRESTENYRVQEDGSVKGYTRYGAWYGAPYGDWCAMYLAFCMDYAGVENLPLEASCPAWISKLSAEDCGLYHDTASGYVPQAGDLVFFDTDYNGTAQHAGLVAEVTLGADGTPETIVTIEGNTASNCVEYMQYEGSSPIIMGYGELRQPEEQLLKNTLTYENSEMTVTAVFPAGFTLPENAVLQVQELTDDMPDYQAMADSVREAIVSGENGDLKTLKLYTWYLECEDETLQLPEDLNVDITVEYNEPLYTEEEQALAEVLTVITLEQPPVQTYSLRKTSSGEEEADGTAGYVVDVPESTVTNVEDGVTGFNLKGVVIKPTFGVAAAIEQKQGDVWYRVDQISELTAGDTVMIVSAEGNTALTYQGTDSGLAVNLMQVTGHPSYYDILAKSDSSTMVTGHNGSLFTVGSVGNNSLTLKNQRDTGRYLALSGSNVFATNKTTLTLERKSAKGETKHNVTWRIKGGNYLEYARNAKMISASSRSYTAAQGKNARLDMLIFRLDDVTLEVPQKAALASSEVKIPDMPTYTTKKPSDEKEGTTSNIEGLKEFTVKYASDQATSDIEGKFAGVESDDGKVLTDKSVIYGGDDYGAFSSYAEGTFGVTLSALGQTLTQKGQLEPLLDVVIILDTSYSMINKSSGYLDENGNVRMVWAMKAVNEVIHKVMQEEDNRVGLVTFSDTSQMVLPLDHYVTGADHQYLDLIPDNSKDDRYTNNQYPNHGRDNNFYDLNINANVRNLNGEKPPEFDFLYGPGYPNWEGTYTQSGIQEAANILLGHEDVKDEYGNPRQPVIILISDGGPTFCSSNYKDPLKGPLYGNAGQTAEGDQDTDHTSGERAGANRYGINGYYTVLTAQYFEDLVGSHYGRLARFASVGIGIESVQSSDTNQRLHDNRYARAVLNPTENFLNTALTAYDGYADEGQQFVNLLNNNLNKQYVSIPNHSLGYTTVGTTYSAVPVLSNPYEVYTYADQYYNGRSGELADDLISYLNNIQFREHSFRTILQTNTEVVIEDPLGEGMEIKDAPVLRFGSKNYAATSTKTADNVTTYLYDYQVKYADAYPKNAASDNKDVQNITLDLSQIVVTVKTEGEGAETLQTVTMKVPEQVLPMLYPEFYGGFYYREDPIRLIYQVGLTAEAVEECKNMSLGETRTFYTNRWTGDDNADGCFTSYNGMDYRNEYPYDEMEAVKKEGKAKANASGTTKNSFNIEVKGNNIIQKLGNNGKLVIMGESTSLSVEKHWSDTAAHSPVTVHLLADGKVVSGQSITLGDSNGWKYTWTGLPKYNAAGVEINYTVSEGYVSGYESEIKGPGNSVDVYAWSSVDDPTNGKECMLVSSKGALGVKTDNQFYWIDVDMNSGTQPANAIWSYNTNKWTNQRTSAVMGYSNNMFTATGNKSIRFSNEKLRFTSSNKTYYFTGINSAGQGTTSTSPSSAILFTLYEWNATQQNVPDDTYFIVNTKTGTEKTPLELTLRKRGNTSDTALLSGAVFDLYQVTSNGTVTIPGTEDKGRLIAHGIEVDGETKITIPGEDGEYCLVETEAPAGFILPDEPVCFTVTNGTVKLDAGETKAEASGTTVTVINEAGFVLPSTGSTGTIWFVSGGVLLMLASALILIYRNSERRSA